MKRFSICFIVIITALFITCCKKADVSYVHCRDSLYNNMQNISHYNGCILPMADGSVIYSVTTHQGDDDGLYIKAPDGTVRQLLSGWYFNLQVADGNLYAATTESVVYGPEYLKRINLKTGKEDTFSYQTSHAYILSDGSVIYSDIDGVHVCSSWEDQSELILSKTDSTLHMKANEAGEVFIFNLDALYLYEPKADVKTIYSAPEQYLIWNIACMGNNIAIILQHDDEYIARYITIDGTLVSENEMRVIHHPQYTAKDLSGEPYIVDENGAKILSSNHIPFDLNCKLGDKYLISIAPGGPELATFDEGKTIYTLSDTDLKKLE